MPCHFTNCIMQADFRCLKSNHSNCRAFKLAEGKGIPSLVKPFSQAGFKGAVRFRSPSAAQWRRSLGFSEVTGLCRSLCLQTYLQSGSTHGHSCRRSSDCVCKDGAVAMCACLSARPGMRVLMCLLLCSWKASCGYLTRGYNSPRILRRAGSKPWVLLGQGFCAQSGKDCDSALKGVQ